MTTLDLVALRRLVDAATPGEWTSCKAGRVVGGPMRHYTNGSTQSQIASFSVTFHDQAPDDEPERQQANADFCAAFNPEVARALLDSLERAQKELEHARWCAEVNSDAHKEELAEVSRDAARLDWLDQQGYAYGFEDMHEGNRWMMDGPFNTLRSAIDAAIATQQGAQP